MAESPSVASDSKSAVGPGAEEARPDEDRISLKKWNAVALWSWDIEVDTCAICHNLIMEQCIECQANQRGTESSDCSVAWGVCNHAYHFHCISRWLRTRSVCPLDNTDWDFQKCQPMSRVVHGLSYEPGRWQHMNHTIGIHSGSACY